MTKIFVEVNAKFAKDGLVTPKSINWEDGRTFEIDRIVNTRKAASLKCGGVGLRYDCFIRGKQVYLFKEDDQWFIEGRHK